MNEVDGSEEVVGVGILGIDSKSVAQIAAGAHRMLLLECDAGQLDGKPFVARSESLSGKERRTSLIETPGLGQCGSIRVFEIGRLVGDRLEFADDFCPALLSGELLEMLRLLRTYWL